ncbi:hypothetical protein EG351_18945 [Chryseobacterium bernardetii]|nr:hypothetical protein EG351_18945 [Chryseobacterium bernardetii]
MYSVNEETPIDKLLYSDFPSSPSNPFLPATITHYLAKYALKQHVIKITNRKISINKFRYQ